jgi:hypothetical protein
MISKERTALLENPAHLYDVDASYAGQNVDSNRTFVAVSFQSPKL